MYFNTQCKRHVHTCAHASCIFSTLSECTKNMNTRPQCHSVMLQYPCFVFSSISVIKMYIWDNLSWFEHHMCPRTLHLSQHFAFDLIVSVPGAQAVGPLMGVRGHLLGRRSFLACKCADVVMFCLHSSNEFDHSAARRDTTPTLLILARA